jgi:type II secretory pathway pseudopilin PulG
MYRYSSISRLWKSACQPKNELSQVRFFTLLELVLVVALIGILALLAVPRFAGDAMKRSAVRAAGREITAELRLARSRAVSEAIANPVGYAVRMTGGPPYTGYETVNLLTTTVIENHSLPAGVLSSGDDAFSFTPLGSLAVGSGTSLSLSAGGEQYTITLVSATGSATLEKQ